MMCNTPPFDAAGRGPQGSTKTLCRGGVDSKREREREWLVLQVDCVPFPSNYACTNPSFSLNLTPTCLRVSRKSASWVWA